MPCGLALKAQNSANPHKIIIYFFNTYIRRGTAKRLRANGCE